MRFFAFLAVLLLSGPSGPRTGSSGSDLGVDLLHAGTPFGGPGCGWTYVLGCSGQGGDHWFAMDEDGPQVGGFSHYDCWVCSSECHPWECYLHEEDSENQMAYRDAVDAADRADIYALLDAARLLPEYVVLNRERRSFQVFGCNGESVIANIPLDDHDFSEARERLE